MGKIESGVELYRNQGLRTLLAEGWVDLAAKSPLSPYVQKLLGDPLHEKTILFARLGYWPQIKNPRSFNEKVAHRKLYTAHDAFSLVTDKWRVREYVRERVGADVLNEVHHVTEDVSTIPFESLPEEFVIKATHGSGWNMIVDDKSSVDVDAVRSTCEQWLSAEFGSKVKEYWYDGITPRVMVERRLHDSEFDPPLDFKFFVFGGDVKLIQVDFDRFGDQKRTFYDSEWNALDIDRLHPRGPVIDEPAQFDEMCEIAETLADGLGFARVDLYNPDGDGIVFGEITLAPKSGRGPFSPTAVDFELGSYW